MKLLQTQYQDILNAMSELDVASEKVSLVKKRGRITIRIEGQDSSFEFFRRKSVSLTPEDHQWEKSERYELNVAGKPSIVKSWPEVVQSLRSWLHMTKK